MYRDDKDAADALAQQLRRDNEELVEDKTRLERENAKLKAELATRPPASQKQKKQKKGKGKRKRKDASENKPKPNGADLVRGKTYNWAVRVACGLAAGVLSFAITRALYPHLHHGKEGMFPAILGAVVNQIWSITLIAQSILGWWPDEDADSGIAMTSTRSRLLAIAGGMLAIALTAAFVALVGESSGGL